MLHIARVYADSSVFGGVFDDEFAGPSRVFFDLVRRGRFHLVISAAVRLELAGAPPQVQALLAEMVALSEAGCALIVSWNFRHIVHYQRIAMYNAVNTVRGYGVLGIHSPLEVVAGEDENV